MKIHQLTIESKNKKAITKFINFLTKQTHLLNLNLTKKIVFYNIKNKKMSILKSPHVHKTAQEQFEFKLFSVKIFIETTRNLKFLTFLKKIQNTLFSEIKLKLKLITSEKLYDEKNLGNQLKETSKSFNKTINDKNKATKLLKFLDYYGELYLKSLGSSVGRAKD